MLVDYILTVFNLLHHLSPGTQGLLLLPFTIMQPLALIKVNISKINSMLAAMERALAILSPLYHHVFDVFIFEHLQHWGRSQVWQQF